MAISKRQAAAFVADCTTEEHIQNVLDALDERNGQLGLKQLQLAKKKAAESKGWSGNPADIAIGDGRGNILQLSESERRQRSADSLAALSPGLSQERAAEVDDEFWQRRAERTF